MNTFRKSFPLLALVLAVTFNAPAATNDASKFSGTVVDAQGHPVPGATVAYYQYPTRAVFGPADLEVKQQVVTDDRGAFELSAVQGQSVAVVTKAGYAPAWRTWYMASPEAPNIVLATASVLAGTVVDNAGHPVADAEVWVSAALNKAATDFGQPSFVTGKIARRLFSVRTSADGKFRIENFPADAQAMLVVKKAGQAMRPTANSFRYDELPFHAGQEDITLTLDPAGSITGKVVVRGTGQPLAFAAISLQPATPGIGNFLYDQAAIVSAADGSFQIPDVPAGAYQLTAIFTNQPMADWVVDSVPVTVAAGQTVPNLQLPAYKGGVVEVTVRAKKSHEPLADVMVTANNQDGQYNNRNCSTGTNGVAYLRLPPGQFTLFAMKPDWSQAQMQTTVTEGQTTQVTIELNEPFTITGMVRDTSGAPVAGASVGVYPNFGNIQSDAKTDANGHYTVNWQEPAWAGMQNQSYHLLARQMDRKLAAMHDIDETTTNLDLTLTPAMSVTAHLQDSHGKPVTNAMGYVSIHQDNSSFTLTRQPARADAQGRLQAEGLPMGERYGWYVSARGYGSAQQEMDAADPKADHYDFPPLVLKLADRKLAGRVLDKNGAPAAGVQVGINGEGQPNGNATTDANGRFAFDAVCEGPVTVYANSRGANGSTDAMGGDTNVVIRFEARNNTFMAASQQTLTGTVFDPAGDHAAGLRVIVTPNWGQIDNAKTDANGDYSVHWQTQPGMRNTKYFVIARDVEHDLAAIEAIDTNSTRVTLRLEPGLTISGTVQDRQGAPLVHANVNLNMMAGNTFGMVEREPVKVDTDGTFSIPALPMGQQYLVFVSVKGYGSANKRIGVNESRTNSVQLSPFKLKAATLPLAGRVLGTDGKPVAGAQVSINGQDQPNGNLRTDEDGHFKFTVCDGQVQVFAYSQSGPRGFSSGNVQTFGGDTNVVVKLGVQQQMQQRQVARRQVPLKPQPWTMNAITGWPAAHKTGTIVLLSVQAGVLLGTGGGIFWFTRRRG